LLLMERRLVVRMTWQEMAVCGSDELVERIKQIDERGEVTEEASRVRLRLVLQDGKQPGSTEFSLPAHVGPVSVRHQLRKHVGLYDKLIRDELPDPSVAWNVQPLSKHKSRRQVVPRGKRYRSLCLRRVQQTSPSNDERSSAQNLSEGKTGATMQRVRAAYIWFNGR
jgi:hypothetical protein